MPFSESFRSFVRENIASVEQARVLVIMGEQPERAWTTDELSAELLSSPMAITQRLRVLLNRKLIAGNDTEGYRYRPDSKHDDLVKELRDQFKLRPVSVIELIFSDPSSLESFSNAFRIGGDKRDDG